jgi:hypothetical protein
MALRARTTARKASWTNRRSQNMNAKPRRNGPNENPRWRANTQNAKPKSLANANIQTPERPLAARIDRMPPSMIGASQAHAHCALAKSNRRIG